MPLKPVRAVVLMKDKCPLAMTLASNGLSDIVVKPISVYNKSNRISMWARVKGKKRDIKKALRLLSRAGNASFTVINESQDSMLIHIAFSSHQCPNRDKCPLVNPVSDLLVTSSLFSGPHIMMLVISPSLRNLRALKKRGFEILDLIEANEPGMLTEDQESILLYAYEKGYYNYPRKTTLKDISGSLGLSLSTVAELLRRAEKKIVDYIVLYDALLFRYRVDGYKRKTLDDDRNSRH